MVSPNVKLLFILQSMNKQSLIGRGINAYTLVHHEINLVSDYEHHANKKVVRTINLVFFEDQTIKDDYMVKYDNQHIIHIVKNSMFHSRSKHIDIIIIGYNKFLIRKKFQLKIEKIIQMLIGLI